MSGKHSEGKHKLDAVNELDAVKNRLSYALTGDKNYTVSQMSAIMRNKSLKPHLPPLPNTNTKGTNTKGGKKHKKTKKHRKSNKKTKKNFFYFF